MSLTAMEIAYMVEESRAKVIISLSRVVPDMELRKEIVGEIVRTKHYIRYLDCIRKLGPIGTKLVIIVIYEAIDQPDQALVELEKYMYSYFTLLEHRSVACV